MRGNAANRPEDVDKGTESHFKFLFRVLISRIPLTNIPFTSRSLRAEDGEVEFSNISASYLFVVHVAIRFIDKQDQQDRQEEPARLSGDIPSCWSKSCTLIIKIVHAAYVRTRNHSQLKSFEYSFPRIHLAAISLEFADVSWIHRAMDLRGGASTMILAGAAVTLFQSRVTW